MAILEKHGEKIKHGKKGEEKDLSRKKKYIYKGGEMTIAKCSGGGR